MRLGFVGLGIMGAPMALNLIMGCMMSAFCGGLTLARQSQLDTAELLDILDAGALGNPMFRGKGPQMLADNFAVAFPLKHTSISAPCCALRTTDQQPGGAAAQET